MSGGIPFLFATLVGNSGFSFAYDFVGVFIIHVIYNMDGIFTA